MGCNLQHVWYISVYILLTSNFIDARRAATTTTRPPTKHSNKLTRILTAHKIIPDVIQTTPYSSLTVKYWNGLKPSLGNIYAVKDVQNAPYFLRWPCRVNKSYVLLMTDPDVPSRDNPIEKEYRHWLIVNIRGPNLMSGKVITKYKGPKPGPGTGLHRYIFLLYRQPVGRIDYSESFSEYHE